MTGIARSERMGVLALLGLVLVLALAGAALAEDAAGTVAAPEEVSTSGGSGPEATEQADRPSSQAEEEAQEATESVPESSIDGAEAPAPSTATGASGTTASTGRTKATSGSALYSLAGIAEQTPMPPRGSVTRELAARGAMPITSGPNIRVSLMESVERSLKRNKSLEVKKLDPALARVQVLKELGAFDDKLRIQFEHDHLKNPTSSTLSGAQVSETDTRFRNLGYDTKFRDGSSLSVDFKNQRNETNSRFNTLNPNSQSGLGLSVNKPLMRGAGRRMATSSLQIAQNSQVQSMLKLKKQVLDSVAQVEKIYWDLTFARQDREVKKFNLAAARELLAYNRSRQEAGLGSDVQVVEAQASEATRLGELRVSERTILDLQETIRRLMSLGEMPAGMEIIPVDYPANPPAPGTLETALLTAFAQRPDYRDALFEVSSKNIRVRYNKNQKLPKIDLVGTYTQNGLDSDWSDAFHQASVGDYPSYTIALQIELPLSNRSARADHAQAVIQKRQALLSVKAVEDQIEEETTRAHRVLLTNLDRVGIARTAADLSGRQLKAAVARYQQGLIANFDLLRYQQDLADARSRALLALLDAVRSWVDLQAATGVLLAARKIVVEDLAHEAYMSGLATPGRARAIVAVPAKGQQSSARQPVPPARKAATERASGANAGGSR